MTRNIMTILQWLPLELDDDKLVYNECKELKKSCTDLCGELGRFMKEFRIKNYSKLHHNINTTETDMFVEKLDGITKRTQDVTKQYVVIIPKLTKEPSDICRARTRFWKDALWKCKLKLVYFLQHLINEIAYLYTSCGENILEQTLQLSNMYNQFLSMDSKYALSKNMQISSNMCPYLLYPFRKISITSLLQVLAENRAELCCHKLIDCVLDNYKFNDTHDDDSSENSSMEIYRAITKHMTPPMEIVEDSPKYQRTEFDDTNSFVNMEELLTYEEQIVLELLNCALKIAPSMLGSDSIRKTKSGTKINPRAKTKVLEYYQQILWGEVGNYLEHIILWWGSSPMSARPPHSSQHLREWINQFIPRADIPPYIVSALSSLSDALGVHVTSTSWDHHFRLALVASKSNGNSDTGRLFCEMLQDLVSLCNQCEITTDWIVGAPLEDLPLVEQIPVLHRLDHSVHTTRLWAANETKRLANNWNVEAFFLITHSDIENCLAQLNGLRLVDHTNEIEKGGLGVHVQVCANMREKLTSEVKINIQKLKECPKQCVDCLASVCTTISLANLQMIFPRHSYWRQNGHEYPEKESSYVEKYLEQILTPVLATTQDYIINNMILKLMCEAWLDHIYLNKIKFTQYGALQLLTDFAFVTTWITNCNIISEEIRKKMLKNEVLRRCEGVGRLLLRSPGEHIKMNDKTKKTAQTESPESGNTELMPAEMYVPNQEQWLELRANRRRIIRLTPTCCGNIPY